MLYFAVLLFLKALKLALLVALGLLCYRIFDAMREPHLRKWHRFSPQEITVAEMRTLDWEGYQKREDTLFEELYRSLEKTPEQQETPTSRYVSSSPNYPPHFERDWNRSFLMQPEGDIQGAAIFLHGLTDSPYTLRHLAEHYTQRGFLSYGLRIPGHGTVPASLAETCWEQWLAAVRMAVRDALARRPANTPLHLIGFSNGGALAVKYALDAIADPLLPQADQLVLIAPMIGVFPLARFAKLAALPAHLPGLGKSAWLIVAPEYNPSYMPICLQMAANWCFLMSSGVSCSIQPKQRRTTPLSVRCIPSPLSNTSSPLSLKLRVKTELENAFMMH